MESTHFQDFFQNINFIFNHPLKATSSCIEELIGTLSSEAHLKDAKTRRYILANKFAARLAGLSVDELIGLSVEDMNMGLLHGSKPAFVDAIKALDEKVNVNQCPALLKETFIAHDGFIRVRDIIKMPVMDKTNSKTIAIFAYSDDRTTRLNLFSLFELYKQHYLPKQAIEQFLGYLKVGAYFNHDQMPTHTEVQVLLAMCPDSQHKKVAKLLKIQPRTVDCHSFALQQKLKEGITLRNVLATIRNEDNRYTLPTEDRLNS